MRIFCFMTVLLLACGPEVEEGKAFVTSSGNAEQGDGDGDGDEDGDGDAGGTDGTSGAMDGDESGASGDPVDMPGDESGDSGTTGALPCGNGVIDMGEQCDGVDLNGFTCEQLGYGGGSLLCDPVTCTYDTSMCIPDQGGTSG